MTITKRSIKSNDTMIRATGDSAAQLSKLALSLFTANEAGHKACGLDKPSRKVAMAYCICVCEPEFKALGVRLSANNNVWLRIQQAERTALNEREKAE